MHVQRTCLKGQNLHWNACVCTIIRDCYVLVCSFGTQLVGSFITHLSCRENVISVALCHPLPHEHALYNCACVCVCEQ